MARRGAGSVSRAGRSALAAVVLGLALLAGCAPRDEDAAGGAPTLAGGCQPASSPYLAPNAQLADGRITYCAEGDASTGIVESSPLPAGTSVLELLVAGYPDVDGIAVTAHSTDGAHHETLVRDRVGDHWQLLRIEVPPTLRDRPFVVRVTDDATATFGWAGIGFTAPGGAGPGWAHLGALLFAPLLAHAWLVAAALALPAAWRRGVAGPLLALGAVAFATVLATMLAPGAGRGFAWLALLGPPAWVAWRDRGRWPWTEAAGLSRRLLPAAVLAAFVLWIGLYPFHWNGDDWQVPAMRWRAMPIDNWLPLMFGQMLAGGELARPLVGDWLASDRPPLQAGVFLLFRDLLPGGDGLGYQAVSAWAQGLVVVAVAPLVARIAPGRERGAMLLALALSATVVFNTLFVWPKLLAAAYCALYHALVFRRDGGRGVAVAAGLAAAFALLSHGGAFFALAGSTVAWLLTRRAAAVRPLVIVALAAGIAYAPWAAWQRTVDPPGDRLLKWHFAGVVAPTPRPLGEVLVAAYREVTLDEWLYARRRNVDRVVEGTFRTFADVAAVLADPGDRAAKWRVMEKSFFSTVHSLWLFSPLWIPLAWLGLRLRGRRLDLPDGLAAAVGLGLVAWVVLMFKPDQTVVHQGAHFLVLALQVLAMAAVRQLAGATAVVAIVGVHAAVAVLAYGFDRIGAVASPGTYVAVTLAAVAALALACDRAAAAADLPERT